MKCYKTEQGSVSALACSRRNVYAEKDVLFVHWTNYKTNRLDFKLLYCKQEEFTLHLLYSKLEFICFLPSRWMELMSESSITLKLSTWLNVSTVWHALCQFGLFSSWIHYATKSFWQAALSIKCWIELWWFSFLPLLLRGILIDPDKLACKGFMRSQTLGKFRGWEDNFVQLLSKSQLRRLKN